MMRLSRRPEIDALPPASRADGHAPLAASHQAKRLPPAPSRWRVWRKLMVPGRVGAVSRELRAGVFRGRALT
jgi:hypothetical protein